MKKYGLYGLIAIISLLFSSFVTVFWMTPEPQGITEEMKASMIADMMGDDWKDLPVKTVGSEMLDFLVKNGAKEFLLTAEPMVWAYAENKTVQAWGFNGLIPGPEIRVTEGDKVRVVFTNKLPKATTIHWHGIDVPNSQDGVPGVTQKAILPGETVVYEFTAKPAGTRWYHTHGSSHGTEAQQLDMGLSGAFIIESKNKEVYGQEYMLLLDEWEVQSDSTNAAVLMSHAHDGMVHSMNYNVFTINGKISPYTTPLKVKEGDIVLLRLINAGTSTTHPIHLHGHSMRIVAVDGNPVPSIAQLIKDTIPIAPGERFDVEIIANNPGRWVLHCHELHHAGGGMIVEFVYE